MIIEFRDVLDDDFSFIMASWLKSYRQANKDIKTTIFFEHEPTRITEILKNSDVLIACNPEDPDQIYGYLIFKKTGDSTIIHYAYIKRTFRKFGIFKKMLKNINPQNTIYATHRTDYFKFLKHRFDLTYNPYLRYFHGQE